MALIFLVEVGGAVRVPSGFFFFFPIEESSVMKSKGMEEIGERSGQVMKSIRTLQCAGTSSSGKNLQGEGESSSSGSTSMSVSNPVPFLNQSCNGTAHLSVKFHEEEEVGRRLCRRLHRFGLPSVLSACESDCPAASISMLEIGNDYYTHNGS